MSNQRRDEAGFGQLLRGRCQPGVGVVIRNQFSNLSRVRVRQFVAVYDRFGTKIDWRRGERHFRHLLSDAEPSQNAGNWQWVAGTGPDAAPYFRIFNPVAQSRRFDAEGSYIRRWVPELAALDEATIHAPWEAAPLDLAAAGIVLDDTYPAPIVDHGSARDRTLAAYSAALER